MSDIGLATALHVVSTFSSFLVETGRSSAVASLFMSFMGEFYTNIDRVSDVSRFASLGYRLVRIIAFILQTSSFTAPLVLVPPQELEED